MTLRQQLEAGERVFPSHPRVDRYFPAAAIENARRRLVRSVERGDGPCVVIGSAGTGKSLLLQVLAAGFRERFDVVLLGCASLCTRRALLQAIHFELGLEFRRRDEGQLRLSLLDQLLAADQSVAGLLLLVDEAQSLAPHLIEELRVLTNLVRGGASRVRLVLAGLPSLEETLAGPELESFSQRLAARCYLGKLTRNETTQYVRAHLAAASIDPDALFTADAWPAAFDATDGVPRLVNQLCDQVLVLAAERNLSQIDRALVQEAWAELQQLPVPWEMTAEAGSSESGGSSVVEFGSLDDVESPAEVKIGAAAVESPPPTTFTPAPVEPAPSTGDEMEVVDPTELDDENEAVESAAVDAPNSADESAVADHADESPAVSRHESQEASPPVPSAAAPPRRPRVFGGCIPEAIDPFAGAFDEEELVLEGFTAMSAIVHPRTPRVENRRNPGFALLLGHALRASSATEADQGEAEDEAQSPPPGSEPDRSSIRLAVMADSAVHDAEPHAPPPAPESAEDDKPDEQPTQFDDVIISGWPSQPPPVGRTAEGVSVAATGAAFAWSGVTDAMAADVAGHADDDDAVLIIEDDSTQVARVGAGVRREEYRDLFSRLRQG